MCLRIRLSQNTSVVSQYLLEVALGKAWGNKGGAGSAKTASYKSMELEPVDRGRDKEGVSPSTLSPVDVGFSDSSL